MQIPIRYDYAGGRLYGYATLPDGRVVRASTETAPIVGAVGDRLGLDNMQRLGCYSQVGGVDIVGAIDDEVGAQLGLVDEVGRRRLRRRIKKGLKKVGKGLKTAVKAVGTVAKKIVSNKLTKGLWTLLKKIPIYGQIADYVEDAVKLVGSGVKKLIPDKKRKELSSAIASAEEAADKAANARKAGSSLLPKLEAEAEAKARRLKALTDEAKADVERATGKKVIRSSKAKPKAPAVSTQRAVRRTRREARREARGPEAKSKALDAAKKAGVGKPRTAPPPVSATRKGGKPRVKKLGAKRWSVITSSGRTATVQL